MTLTCDECGDDADPEKVKNLVRPGTDDDSDPYRLCVWCQPEYRSDRQYTPNPADLEGEPDSQ